MSTPNRVSLSRTEKEWEVIDKRLQEMGRSDFTAYLVGRISLLERQYADNPNIVCTAVSRRIQKQPIIPEQYYKLLIKISVKTGFPISVVVDRLIIDPLLLSK